MRHRVGALDRGNLQQLLRDQRSRQRRRHRQRVEQARIASNRRHHEVACEGFANVEHVGPYRAERQRPIADDLEIDPLADVQRHRHDFGAALSEPVHGNRRGETAGIGEDDAWHGLVACPLEAGVFAQASGKRRGAPAVLGNDQNRVIAGDGADGFWQSGTIDRERKRLRLPGAGPHHHHLLDTVDAGEEFRGRTLERGQDRGWRPRVNAGTLIGAVAGALDQPQVLDVARNRRLRDLEAALLERCKTTTGIGLKWSESTNWRWNLVQVMLPRINGTEITWT